MWGMKPKLRVIQGGRGPLPLEGRCEAYVVRRNFLWEPRCRRNAVEFVLGARLCRQHATLVWEQWELRVVCYNRIIDSEGKVVKRW